MGYFSLGILHHNFILVRLKNMHISQLPQKRKQVGNMGRLLDKCQKTLDKLTENIITERNEKINVQKQILDEYKQIRKVYEDLTNTVKEQLITANNLRREQNELLRELISAKRTEKEII